MSRWLSDETRIALSKDRVSLARIRHRLRPRVIGTFSLETQQPPSNSEPWRATLETLHELLGRSRPCGAVTVIVSNALLRFAIVPWQPRVLRYEERQALARYYLRLRFGDALSNARVVVSTPAFGQSSIGCAIESAFLFGIEKEIASRGGEATSIQPLLMSVANAYARQLKHSTVLAIVESDCVAVMCVSKNRELLHVATRRLVGEINTLQAILSQELAVLPQAFTPERLLLFTPEPSEGALLALPWRVERLQLPALTGFDPAKHGTSSLALCGI